jgi:hypothetical protein
MYTQSQLVTIAMEAPLFLDRLELISDGYRNGMAKNERPFDSVLVGRRWTVGEHTHMEEIVEEDESHCMEPAADRTRDIQGENPNDRSSTTGLSRSIIKSQQYTPTATPHS